jgi:hypothetical protein
MPLYNATTQWAELQSAIFELPNVKVLPDFRGTTKFPIDWFIPTGSLRRFRRGGNLERKSLELLRLMVSATDRAV